MLRGLGAAALAGAAGCLGVGAEGNGGSESIDGAAHAAAGGVAGEAERRVETVGRGTDQTADLHVVEAPADGPTFFLLGGVHGDEASGRRAATAATEWRIDAGRLVVLPRANPGAVRNGERRYPRETDLNRQFPVGERPTTPYARAVWRAIRRHDPDVLLDLHSSLGVYARDRGYVGQQVFHSAHPRIAAACADATARLNRRYVPANRPDYEFGHSRLSTEKGMIATKAAADLDAPAALFETTRDGLSAATQVEWTTAFARLLLDRWGVRRLRG